MKRLLAFLGLAAAMGAKQPIVIRGARVVDGAGSPARIATVVIRGSRIEAVAPAGDAEPVPP